MHNMEQIEDKAIGIALLFLLTLLFGCLPIWLHYRRLLSADGSVGRKLFLDYLNCFAGGVLLGACLLSLLTGGQAHLAEYKKLVNYDNSFPLYEAVAGLGLCLVSLLEKLIFACLANSGLGRSSSLSFPGEEERDGIDGEESSSTIRPSALCLNKGQGGRYPHISRCRGPRSVVTSPDEREGPSSSDDLSSSSLTNSEGRGRSTSGVEVEVASSFCFDDYDDDDDDDDDSRERQPLTTSSSGSAAMPVTSRLSKWSKSGSDGKTCRPDDGGDSMLGHGHQHRPRLVHVSTVRTLLLLGALSLHTVFDGLAVGLQDSSRSIWQMLIAIAIHKSLVAFCLGLNLATTFITSTPITPGLSAGSNNGGGSTKAFLCMLVFSFISPLGVGLSMVVMSDQVDVLAHLLVSSILQALATGTFLYVIFFEIIGQHLAYGHEEGGSLWNEVCKSGMLLMGFLCMAGMTFLNYF